MTINFTDLSSNVAKWEWAFYDNTKSSNQNTSHTYSLPVDTDQYLINGEVSFVTTLTVESPGGCKATKQKTLIIKKPTALFSVDKVEGCIPLKIKFKDKSLTDKPENLITNWEWIFSNTQKSSGTVDSAEFTYSADGTFPSKLVITNNQGCKDTSYIININAGKKLLPDFIPGTTDVCQNQEISLFNNTPESWLIQRWHYQVGGVDVDALPNEPNPQWIMHADTGWLDIKLEVTYNGCISDTVKVGAIHNKGPLARFDYDFDCDDPYNYSFTNLSEGIQSFQWNFGDAAQNTIDVNPSHGYSTDGDYNVELVIDKGSCSDTYQKIIPVREPKAVIKGEMNACVDQSLMLSGDKSYGIVDYCYEKYLWDFGDSTAKIFTNYDTLAHIFTKRGTYTVKLYTAFDNGCNDSATLNVTAFQPYAGFYADTLLGCSPFIVNFTDTSKSDTHPIEEWKWIFEPGKDSTYTSKLDSISHWFNNPGEFDVSLLLTDTLGCQGGASVTISTANPNAEFYVANPQVCLGNDVSYNFFTQDVDSMIWDFGDGTFSNDITQPVTHRYQDSGSYFANLIIYRYGCSDSYTQSSPTYVQLADAHFGVSDTFWNCYPKEIIFNHNIPGQQIVSGIWNFGYGNTPPSEYSSNKVFTYPKPGDYTASLSILTSFGCTDTATQNIEITGPTGDFMMSKNYACKGDEITFDTLFTNDVFDYEWDMGDGTTFLKGSPVVHVYNSVGPFYPKLLLYGDSGRCKPPAFVDTLLIAEVIADFEVPDTGLCNTYDITLTNHSTGNQTNSWNINNDIFTSDVNPSFTLAEGAYIVSLLVKNDIGCTDTAEKSFIANPLPVVQIMNDTLICEGDKINIWVTGGDNVTWTPSTGLSSYISYTPEASPDITTLYTAIVKYVLTGCQSTDNIQIFVQRAPDFTVYPTDTSVIIGEIVKIRIDSLDDFTYEWSSSPSDDLINCTFCAAPLLHPLENTNYTLMVADTNNCFTEDYYVYVRVDEKYSVDVPTAFTPAGDPENAVVFVKGWGIMKLLEFRIYNRYGNEVFYTNDINQGWDGRYKGKLQNIDSYAYVVRAEMWDGTTQTKKGTINLLR